jgi:Transposase IS116/IS110/IS902 family
LPYNIEVPQEKKGKPTKNAPRFDLGSELRRITGVDLTRFDGIDVMVTQTLLSEVGMDMSQWNTEAHFSSWLGLCPDNRISGDKLLGNGTRHVVNRAATALRLAARNLIRSRSYLGVQYRRLRTKLGAPKAITAWLTASLDSSIAAEVRSTIRRQRHGVPRREIPQPTNPIAPQEGCQTRAAARARAGLTYVSEEVYKTESFGENTPYSEPEAGSRKPEAAPARCSIQPCRIRIAAMRSTAFPRFSIDKSVSRSKRLASAEVRRSSQR